MRTRADHVEADCAWALIFSASAVLTIGIEQPLRWAILGSCLAAYLLALARRQKPGGGDRSIRGRSGNSS